MPCYKPLSCYLSESGVVFNAGGAGRPIKIPCGHCIGCRLERSRQWAVRCMHESSMHELSCYVTLTYRPEELPAHGTLVKSHFQLFMKRLRIFPARKLYAPGVISYFQCGEYGEQPDLSLGRPHYHAILFGVHFPDQYFYKDSEAGDKLFKSPTLDSLWTHGDCLIGAVTFDSAAYVARYCVKKITGDSAQAHYEHVDFKTGEVTQRVPEYSSMSLRPAIGLRWYDKFSSEVVKHDSVVSKGVQAKPPRYYDKLLRARDEPAYDALKIVRRKAAEEPQRKRNSTTKRLAVREQCKIAQVKSLKRTLND